jgi:hypothetical protein
MKKIKFLLIGGGGTILLFIIGISIYTRIFSKPIIFFASLFIGIISVILNCFFIQKFSKNLFETFTLFIIGLVYYLGLILLSIFGPTFIDRSISYHIAFYAVEKKSFYVSDIEREFSKEIFDKRVHEAITTGFLKQNKNGSVSSTIKSKIMYVVLKPIGEITNSMVTYNEMKIKLERKK